MEIPVTGVQAILDQAAFGVGMASLRDRDGMPDLAIHVRNCLSVLTGI